MLRCVYLCVTSGLPSTRLPSLARLPFCSVIQIYLSLSRAIAKRTSESSINFLFVSLFLSRFLWFIFYNDFILNLFRMLLAVIACALALNMVTNPDKLLSWLIWMNSTFVTCARLEGFTNRNSFILHHTFIHIIWMNFYILFCHSLIQCRKTVETAN